MGELAPVAGIASTAVVGSGSTADRSAADRAPPGHGRPPPRPPPGAGTPSTRSPGPAVELARQGLLLEALVRERAGPALRSEATGLAGTVRVVPLAPGEPTPPDDPVARPRPWREGARIVTVLGSAGPDGLLAEGEGILLLLRGARLHLPPGARLRIAWEGPPRPLDRPPAGLGPAPPPPATSPASALGPTAPSVSPPVLSRSAPPPGTAAAAPYGSALALAASGPAPVPRRWSPSPTASFDSLVEAESGTGGAPATAGRTSLDGASEPEGSPAAVADPKRPPGWSSGANPDGASTDPASAATSPAGTTARAENPERDAESAARGLVPDPGGTSTPIPRTASTPADLPSLGEAARCLAGLLGLTVEREPREERRERARGAGPERDREEGRSRLVVLLPEIGRVELVIAWSPSRVELAIHGLPPLRGVERAALLRAFEAALAAGGAVGRAVLTTTGGPTAAEPMTSGEPTPVPERDSRSTSG
ncbi:MAG: hypothetical protein K6T74_13945 [Geminicoccaceae bacterium]|nr:hypothetical protein [Geminicoccaceae bacterium]